MTGVANTSNVTKTIPAIDNLTIRWKVYAWDNSSNMNVTSDSFVANYPTAPKYSNPTVDDIRPSAVTHFSVFWTSTIGLKNFTFSYDGNAGVFTNDSVVNFSGASNYSNATKVLPPGQNNLVRWQVYSWDTNGNFNATPIQSFYVTPGQSGGGYGVITTNQSVPISFSVFPQVLVGAVAQEITIIQPLQLSSSEAQKCGEYSVKNDMPTNATIYIRGLGNTSDGALVISVPSGDTLNLTGNETRNIQVCVLRIGTFKVGDYTVTFEDAGKNQVYELKILSASASSLTGFLTMPLFMTDKSIGGIQIGLLYWQAIVIGIIIAGLLVTRT
jgi:hypothetical protein